MIPEFAYFLKVNTALMLLYAFYRLFFYKDTFFKLRRAILLAFFGVSLLYPLLNIQDWLREQESMVEVIHLYSTILPETTVMPVYILETDGHDWLLLGISCLYWSGVLILLFRFFVQLSSILVLARHSEVAWIRNVRVHLLNKPAGPFSFFRLVFLHPAGHSEKEIDEILAHECTHVNQWHSIDVMICEWVCIFCWVNPFVWLLKREVRHNLEYLADDRVLEAGYDSRSYQYHLLGLAHTDRPVASLSNNFNMLHLKNRISMMNKKRSRSIGKTKYLIFIPIVGALSILSNIDTLARITDELAGGTFTSALLPDIIQPFPVAVNTVPAEKREEYVRLDDHAGETRNEVFTVTEKIPEFPGGQSARLSDEKKKPVAGRPVKGIDRSGRVFSIVEHMPEFPGGVTSLFNYLATRVKYPVLAQENGIQGRVSCAFIVNADGSLKDIEVIRGIDPLLDEEAVRLIREMPKWNPGIQNGMAVAVKYTIPVTFRLQ